MKALRLESEAAIFEEWQVATWLCCFAGSGVRMRMGMGNIRRLGGALHSFSGFSCVPRHRCPSVPLTWALAGPSHAESWS